VVGIPSDKKACRKEVIDTPSRLRPAKREEPPTVKTRNRISPYEAGWLTMLVEQGIATQEDARAAMNRVAQEALDEINRLRQGRRGKKRRKKD
jgi:hypothetical protein